MNHLDDTPDSLPRVDRRTALKWMLAATASLTLLDRTTLGLANPSAPRAARKGYGTDPNLTRGYQLGEFWPLTFTEEQRRSAGALCDIIIPADDRSPPATAVGVVDFIDEWISAPYGGMRDDRVTILEGLLWLNEESHRRFGRGFAVLKDAEKCSICDDICYLPNAKPTFQVPARFFARFRDLTAGGYYTTPQGAKDLNYIGNVPLASWDGPPLEALKKAGLI